MSLLYERRLESCYIERIYPYSESNAFLGVSICSRLFSEKTLIALFDWCKVNVKSVYVKGAGSAKTTIKTAQSKKKYYVRVRAYKERGKAKVYSYWSNTLFAKVK